MFVNEFGGLAQLVEYLPYKQWVIGSSPIVPTKLKSVRLYFFILRIYMKILYLHHANRISGVDDISRLGTRDAQITAKLLFQRHKEQPLTVIYSAPSNRCLKTANIINKKLRLPLVIDNNLNEFDSHSESWLDAQIRIHSFLKQIVKTHDNNAIIICVTSGVNVAAFFDFANNRQPSENNAFVGLISCSPLVFDIQKPQ